MYKYINKISRSLLVAAVALSGLTACNQTTIDMGDDDDDEVTTVGRGQLNLKQFTVDITNATQNAETRSAATRAEGSSQSVDTYTVRVIKTSTEEKVYEWIYSEMPEVVTLPVGNYKLEAYNAEVADVAWDTPYYYASQSCDIAADKVTEPQTLVCKLASVKVTIKYTDALKKLIGKGDDVNVNVKLGSQDADFKYTDTGAVYFKNFGTDSTITATFSGTINGTYISELKTVSTINSGEHHIFNFDVQTVPDPGTRVGMISADGLCLTSSVTIVDLKRNITTEEDVIESTDYIRLSQNTMTLTADGTAKNVNVSSSEAWTMTTSDSWLQVSATNTAAGMNIPVAISATENTTTSERTGTVTFRMGSMKTQLTVTQAGKSGDTTPDTKDAPTITSASDEIDLDVTNKITSASKVAVDINAKAGIKNLVVKIVSDILTKEMLEGVSLTDEFDLANPGQYDEALKGLGFPTGSDVTGKTYINFDISGFMPLLTPSSFQGIHKFVLTVTDQNGATTTKTLALDSRQ